MSDDLVFYTHPMSRGRTVRWMLEEVGCTYRTELLEYGAGMKAPAFLAINPMGKVPAIVHRDVVVTETAAICLYLADAFPGVGLAPPVGDARRGSYYRWMLFAAGPIEAAITNTAMGFEVPEDKRRMAGYGSMADTLDALETAVGGGGFVTGEGFTAADLYLGASLGWGMAFGMIEKRPAFKAYWGLMRDRPAFLRAKAADDALLPEQVR